MTTSCFGRACYRALFAATLGVSVMPAVAQENEAAQPDGGDATPVADSALRQDTIGFYQVRASETEYLPGRLRVADYESGELRGVGTTGVLVIRDGRIVARGETDIGGVAQIRNLRPGPYSVIALGPDGMAAFGMEVEPPVSGVAVPAYRFDTLMVPAADMAVAQQALAGMMRPPAAAGAVPGYRPTPPLPPIPASLKRQSGDVIVPAPLAGPVDADAGEGAAAIKGEQVVIRDGERMVTQLVSLDPKTGQPIPMGSTRVLFLRGGRLLGTIETNAEGYCGATGVDDGPYSMVGVGPNGFIALGVQVETVAGSATADVDSPTTSVTYVSALQDGIPTVNLRAPGASPDALPFAPGLGGPGPFGPGGFGGGGPFPGGGGGPFGGGGAGGGVGGGGGFGGGGGLLGALLGAGLGAALGAAAGNDDNGNGGQNEASPNVPPGP